MARETGERLKTWKDRLTTAEAEYKDVQDRMVRREALRKGSHVILTPNGDEAKDKAAYVRNVCFEMVETQIDSTIPSPKVTAVRQEDEELATIIEAMLRSVLDRLPFERMNDEAERLCPTQGGHGFGVDWNTALSGRGWLGDLSVKMLHPRKIVPQPGIYEVYEMDYIFVKDAVTKKQLKDRYHVDASQLDKEGEDDPEVRGAGKSQTESDELVTMTTVYFRNDKGGVGRFRFVGDVEIEYLEDYQARRVQKCRSCGEVGDGVKCRYCGGKKFDEELLEFEELTEDIVTENGTMIPAESGEVDGYGQTVYEDDPEAEPQLIAGGESFGALGAMAQPIFLTPQRVKKSATKLPYYKPDIFPIVMRKNVSESGSFLGGSDIDAIEDQQNALNKLGTKVHAKTLGGGSFTTTPKGARFIVDDQDNRIVEVDQPSDLDKIRTYNMQVDISQDIALLNRDYEDARQTLGITDSLQGRRDPTATSAVAKQFSAQQAAGRFESKRVMKKAMYADLFEIIFKFMLAYADEPRAIRSYDEQGAEIYKVFDRHDFLYQDEAGAWRYNTDFLFSCDSVTPLVNDRQAMWQECRMNFESGAMGATNDMSTLIRFWRQMERLHYPMAGELRAALEEEMQRQEAMQVQAAMQTAQTAMPPNGGAMQTQGLSTGLTPDVGGAAI